MRLSTILRISLWCVVLGIVLNGSLFAQERTAAVKDELRERYRQSDQQKSGEVLHRSEPVRSNANSGTNDVLVNNNNGAQSDRSFIQSETDIVAFGNNVVIAFNDAGSYTGSNNQFTGWSYSTDGGTTFIDGGTLPVSTIGDAGDPVLARNETTGRIYFSTLGFSGAGTIQMWRSDNNGVTWMAPVNATPGGSNEDKQWHTVDNFPGTGNGNVYMMSRRFGGGPGIYVFRSTDHGDTFGPSVGTLIVSGNQGAFISVGPDHSVYAFWYTTGAIMMRKSTDFGVTFGSPITVASGLIGGVNGDLGLTGRRQGTTTFNSFRSSEFPHVGINPVSGYIYVTHANDGVGVDKADVFFVQSTNGGAAWSAPLKINDDATTTDQWQPTIAVTPSGDQVGIFYYSRQEDPDSNNRFKYYGRIGNISGTTVTFNPSFAISDVASLPEFGRDAVVNSVYMGDYNHAVATSSAFHIVWSDNRDDFTLGPPRKDPNVYYERIPTTENFGWVRGTITNAVGGAMLSGVNVDFTEAIPQVPSISNASGFYKAGAKVDTPGTTVNVTLRARKFGFLDSLIAVTLTRNDTVTRNFAMTPAPGGTLLVRSLRSDSSGIRSNLRVMFGTTEVINDFTDSTTGNYSAPLPAGSYDVVVDPPSPYGTRRFDGVVINASQTTSVVAIVRPVVEHAPAEMHDTLIVGQTHGKNLMLSNTTTDSVPWRLSTEEITFLNLSQQEREEIERSKRQQAVPNLPKGAPNVSVNPAQLNGRGGPDAFGYVWIDSDEPGGPTYNFVDIRGVGTQITGLFDDTNVGPFPIGFSFPYYENMYTQFRFCTNGFLSFTSTSTQYVNSPIPSSVEPNNALYPFWDDLNFSIGVGTAWYYYDAGNNQLIVQYDSVSFYSGPGTNTFQVILKPSGEMLFQYRSMTGAVNSATIGIENANGTIALQVVADAAYLHNNMAILLKLRGVDWLSYAPNAGVLAPSGNQNVTATFNSTGLNPGTTYEANTFLDVTHTDIQGSIIIPSSLRVQPADSALLITTTDSITFPTTPVNATRRDSLIAYNGGLMTLNISSISSTNADFAVSPSSAVLATGESIYVRVTYTPTAEGSDTGRVIMLSNSQGQPRKDIGLRGTAIGVPHFTAHLNGAAMDSLVKLMDGGTRDSILFHVLNDGTGLADYSARAVIFPQTVAPGQSAGPIVIPMKIQLAGKNTTPLESFVPRMSGSFSGADALTNPSSAVGDTRRIVKADTVGQVIISWPAPSGIVLPWGLGWNLDAFNLLVSDPLGPPIENHYVSYDGNLLQSISTPWMGSWPGDAEYHNGFFYQVNVGGNNGIYKLNVDGSVVGFITDPGNVWTLTSQRGLAFDPVENVFYVGGWNQDVIYKVKGFGADVPGQVILSYPFLNISGLAFHPTSRKLWVADNAAVDMIYEVEPNTGAILQQFRAPGTGDGFWGAGLAIHSDGNIWCVNQDMARVFLVESGSPTGAQWLTIQPTQGSLGVGDSVLMTAGFDATDPEIYNNPGNYHGQIEIKATNSLLADTLRIPARMWVQPSDSARLVLNPDSLNFGDVELDSNRTMSVLVRNIGATTLNVTNITTTDVSFSATPTSFSLVFGDTQRVNVTFTASPPPTTHTGVMNFVSNDPDEPSVDLVARSFGTPHIAVQPDTFFRFLQPTGDTTRVNFTVRNTGTDTLDYVIQEILGPRPGPGSAPISSVIYEGYELPKGAIDPHPGIPPMTVNGRGGPDAFGYTWIDSDEPGGPPFNWVEIRGVGTQITTWTGSPDDGYAPVTLPFAFSFYGTSYTNAFVGTNGFMSFGAGYSTFSNTAIPTTATPNNALYAFWDDLDFSVAGGTAWYYHDVANQRFIVQWDTVSHYLPAGETGRYTFQVILRPTGDILYQYRRMEGTLNSATIGIENSGGTIALQVVFSQPYMHNNLAILISRDVPWMSIDRTSGTIAQGDSQQVELRYHPAGMLGGDYDAHLRISGNTPDVRNVAVHLRVEGVSTISVTSPNGGERWLQGTTQQIAWTRQLVDSVKIELSTTGSGGPWTTIVGSWPARPTAMPHPKLDSKDVPGGITEIMGTYNWVVPNVPTTNGFIRVSDKTNPSVFDTNNAPFTILSVPDPDTTWAVQTSPTSQTLYSVKAVTRDIGWAAGGGGVVIRTTNGGANWTLTSPTGPDPIYTVTAINENTAMAGSYSTSFAKIWRTTNGGATWTVVDAIAGGFPNSVDMFDANNAYWQGDPVGGNWELRRTTNGGATWANADTLPGPTEAGWNNSMHWLNSTTGWFGTNSGHIYRTTDGGSSWVQATHPSVNSYSIWFNSLTAGVLGGGSVTNRSTDAGVTWTASGAITGTAVLGMTGMMGSQEFWATSQNNTVTFSSNGGVSWSTAPPNGYSGTGTLYHVNFATVGNNLYGWAVGPTGAIRRFERTGTVSVNDVPEVPTVFALEQNYPNPFNPVTTIQYALPVQSTVALRVFNILGQEVALLVNGEQGQGYYQVVWDGKNQNGAQIASGIYFFRIDAAPTNGGNTFRQIKKMLMIK